MKIVQKKTLEDTNCQVLVYGIYNVKENETPPLPAWVKKDDPSLKDFFGNLGQMVVFSDVQIGKKKFLKAALVGLGKKEKLNALNFCVAYAAAFLGFKSKFYSSIAFVYDRQEFTKVFCSHLIMADYEFLDYKEKKEPPPKIEEINLIVQGSSDLTNDIKLGIIYGQATNYCRSLQNQPANVATTTFMAKQAEKLAQEKGFEIIVFSEEELKKHNMNSLLAVGSGSAHPPYLVILLYRGNRKQKEFDLAIVGKGIVFDSGGLSLKPSEYMENMKFDKSGACVVLGVFEGLAQLKPNKNIVGVLALAENMPSSSAYRPGDIIVAYNKKTIEVLNTDAEGRVALADAISYCIEKYKPKYLIDLATLTGACVVALGDLAAGLMTADEELKNKLLDCSLKTNDRLWPLPTWDEYDEKVKSQVADVKNVGERGMAGAIAGYSFLKVFVDQNTSKWAHLDIAGTAWTEKPKFSLAPGGTGFGVRLILEFLNSI
ncbi:MAG: leucyl aminopeptidase [Candidatus Micrarchaeota archaeon]|nr:leucyl aminopeptidase [Candidatus Micrarchaeota archaeon]